ncbi:hypothetical protein KGP45_11250, partial [Pediococcus ethanolidurans]|uniref:hypothetical protein n=1 Tax=Pediococcus ethanolidurans TaxID=319653 RepID=UPI001C1E911E
MVASLREQPFVLIVKIISFLKFTKLNFYSMYIQRFLSKYKKVLKKIFSPRVNKKGTSTEVNMLGAAPCHA